MRPTGVLVHSTSYTSAAYVANPNVLVRVGSVASTNGTYATIRSVRKTATDSTAGRGGGACDDDNDSGVVHCGGGRTTGGGRGNINGCGSSHVSPYATSYVAAAAGSNNYHVYSKPASPTASKISYYACTPLVSVFWRKSSTGRKGRGQSG